MSNIIQVGDIGTEIELTVRDEGVAVNLSAATTLQILLTSPTGVEKTLTAELVTDGTDGKLRAYTVSGTIDEEGSWYAQARVVTPSWNVTSSRARFSALN